MTTCPECRHDNHRACITRQCGAELVQDICACWAHGHFTETEPWWADYDDADPDEIERALGRYERYVYGE
jgi:hypothetical protein